MIFSHEVWDEIMCTELCRGNGWLGVIPAKRSIVHSVRHIQDSRVVAVLPNRSLKISRGQDEYCIFG